MTIQEMIEQLAANETYTPGSGLKMLFEDAAFDTLKAAQPGSKFIGTFAPEGLEGGPFSGIEMEVTAAEDTTISWQLTENGRNALVGTHGKKDEEIDPVASGSINEGDEQSPWADLTPAEGVDAPPAEDPAMGDMPPEELPPAEGDGTGIEIRAVDGQIVLTMPSNTQRLIKIESSAQGLVRIEEKGAGDSFSNPGGHENMKWAVGAAADQLHRYLQTEIDYGERFDPAIYAAKFGFGTDAITALRTIYGNYYEEADINGLLIRVAGGAY